MDNDTIAAISSGLSEAGISIIRMSGSDAFRIAGDVFRSASGRSFDELRSFTVNYGFIMDGGETVDEVLLLKMKAPHTYTCEDVVEVDCHGGIVVTKRILSLLLSKGARPADPGEFTKRAFLGGRIDLSQAEAVMDIIGSRSERALKNSVRQLKGDLSTRIAALRSNLLGKAAYIEAALDDPEHISLDGFSDELTDDLRRIRSDIDRLISSYDNGRLINEGIRTVILGRPNAGKSSLLNRILGEERAIVTDIAGTTRDTLEETVNLGGILLNIIDTAGIRRTDDPIERIGVNRAVQAASDADLILFVVDRSEPLTDDDIHIFELSRGKKMICLLNKSDLAAAVVSSSDISKYSDCVCLDISAGTGEGIDELEKLISDMFFAGEITGDDEVFITSARHKKLLSDASAAVGRVLDSADMGMSEDFFTIDLLDAYKSLGLITGDDIEDDLADRIFSEFCMGK